MPSLRPASATEGTALLTTCLSLVKPVGMSAADAHAWLMTASDEIAYIPSDILADACTVARRTCTHHGQIVPTIIREAEEHLGARRRLHAAIAPAPADAPKLNSPEPWRPTPEELEQLKAEAAASLRA